VPRRIFALLLPVWRVEIRATVTEGQPYELIDRYLERGIAEAGLTTAAELARFFALDQTLVDRALRFLAAIGHLTDSGDRLGLTPLGEQSVRDKVRYEVIREDRRTLYFDGFGSRPLTRPYYDSRTVTMLTAAELGQALARDAGPRFIQLVSTYGFRPEALAELAGNRDRDRFNLPERIDRPEQIGTEQVYLPLYVLHATECSGRARHLAYTQASAEEDADLTALCEQTPEIAGVLDTEERSARSRLDGTRIADWLRSRGIADARPARLAGGTWRVTLPAASFGTDGPMSISKLGSFVVLGSEFFQVWSADERVRQRALLERIDAYLGSRTRPTQADVEPRLAQIATQLDLGALDLPALRTLAQRADRKSLAAQLARLP
jgi:hypothetical protein